MNQAAKVGGDNLALQSTGQARSTLKLVHDRTALATRTLANLQESNTDQRFTGVDNTKLAAYLKLHPKDEYLASFDPKSEAHHKAKIYRQLKAAERQAREENQKKDDLLRGVGFKVEDMFYQFQRQENARKVEAQRDIEEGGMIEENIVLDGSGNVVSMRQRMVFDPEQQNKKDSREDNVIESLGFEMNPVERPRYIQQPASPKRAIIKEITPPHSRSSQPSLTPPQSPLINFSHTPALKIVPMSPLVSLTQEEEKAQQKAAYTYTKKSNLARDSDFLTISAKDRQSSAAYQSKLLLLN